MLNRYGVVIAFLLLAFLTAGFAARPKTAPAWQAGIAYREGSLASYNGTTYKCVWAHTAIKGWEPDQMPALWERLSGSHKPASGAHEARPRSATRRIFAPYLHVTESSNDLPAIQKASGLKFFTLAFIVSDGGCAPAWQGKTSVRIAAENALASRIKGIEAGSENIVISFGGYAATELAQACPDATSLQAAYQAVIDKYKVNKLDFDVESSAIEDPPSIDRRSQALKGLAAANPGLVISFTLPATPTGMPEPALQVLRSAVKTGTPVAVVNIMAMDYGVPMPQGNMGPAAISAAATALRQVNELGLRAGLGVTPMIGMNDTAGETFTPADAEMLLKYVRKTRDIVLLSMWSVGRDNGTCTGAVAPGCSGIQQRPWEFTEVLRSF